MLRHDDDELILEKFTTCAYPQVWERVIFVDLFNLWSQFFLAEIVYGFTKLQCRKNSVHYITKAVDHWTVI